ncbi:VWA domain-containing protein [Pseudoalteromonas haloplanktis]|uniref:VWA domain-containing protein n=1 Tax=Pseudoalteromonas haloplanktis TaxID=228 RepID=A0ABU1BFC4_PSEHA|nr:VWA domain-containing protein [Pseudoalteromonas haloplanktis]MDQ9093183.1 VWA domain-containing protein [Pseudoalteromonas haloplanktis]
MIIFKTPWLLLLLTLPFILYWLLPTFKQKALAIRIPFFDLAAKASGVKVERGVRVYKKPVVDIFLGFLIWTCITLALAQPIQLGEPKSETIISRDIMLAIDLSGSMEEADFPGSDGNKIARLDAVKNVVGDFIDNRDNDRIGLIVFGTKAYLQVPFTQDLTSTKTILFDSSVAMAGPHTAIGDAIGLAIKTFENSDIEEKVLILLTDGADTGSRMSPLNAAHIAKQEGLTVYTIGIGDEQGEGQYRVDFKTLREIADITDGDFYAATNTDKLTQIYEQIDKVAQAKINSQQTQAKTPLLHIPLIIAACLLVLGLILQLIRERPQEKTA